MQIKKIAVRLHMLKLLSLSLIKLDKVLGTLIYLLQRQLRDVITGDTKTFWCKGLIWMILRRIKHTNTSRQRHLGTKFSLEIQKHIDIRNTTERNSDVIQVCYNKNTVIRLCIWEFFIIA